MPFDGMEPLEKQYTVPAPPRLTWWDRNVRGLTDPYIKATGGARHHFDCMSGSQTLTPREDYELTERLLHAIRTRPDDWSVGEFTTDDQKTGIQIWTCNGALFCHPYKPVDVRLGSRSRRRLFDACHAARHRTPSKAFTDLVAKLDA